MSIPREKLYTYRIEWSEEDQELWEPLQSFLVFLA